MLYYYEIIAQHDSNQRFSQKDIIEQQKTMSSITITIPDDVMKTFTDFKLRHKHKYVLMEIDQER